MCQNHKLVNMGFTREAFPAGTHMCLIYNNEKERKKIVSEFLKGGISGGEQVAYFADDSKPEHIKEWLLEINVELPEKKDSFSVHSTADTYYPTGKFEMEGMLNNLKNFFLTSQKENFPGVRVTGEMSWALKGIPGSDKLMEYESRVNDVVAKYPVTAVCQYDANKFDGATILECLTVHPFMIVHGQIVRNPYYMKTEDYLNDKAKQ